MSTPSFRLIDFGRSINIEEEVSKKLKSSKEELTEEKIKEERAREYRGWGTKRASEELSINKEFGVGYEPVGSR
jgi:hypothetical protein